MPEGADERADPRVANSRALCRARIRRTNVTAHLRAWPLFQVKTRLFVEISPSFQPAFVTEETSHNYRRSHVGQRLKRSKRGDAIIKHSVWCWLRMTGYPARGEPFEANPSHRDR